MRAECSARVFQRRSKPRYTQIVIVCRFWRKLSVVSLPFQIFRRLNALFTALCMQKRGTRVFQRRSKRRHPANRNHSSIWSKIKRYCSPVWDISTFKRSLHCIMLVECIARVFQRRTKPIYTQIAIICRFWRKWNIISLPFEIFQRPNDLFTVRYMQNVVHAYPSDETSPDTRKSQSFADLDEKKRYFSPVWDISTFKPSFHCIMRALCSARDFESKNKPRHRANRNHSSILSKIKRCFSPVWDISTFKHSFHCIMRELCSARDFESQNKPRHPANRNHSSILSKIKRCFSPVWDISTFKRSFHCIMHAKTRYTCFPASK